MVPVLIIVGLFVVYELMNHANTVSVPVTPATSSTQLPLPSYSVVAPQQSNPSMIGSEISLGTTGATLGLAAIGSLATTVVPVLGAVASAIAASLIAASQKRAAEARNENAAVVKGVIGWDTGVAQVVAAYNAGQITLQEVQAFFMCPQQNDPSVPSGQGILWKNYWQECGPQIQPGRNGCQTGTVVQTTFSFCSGSYGASCCVGYDNLKNSSVYMLQAAAKAEASPGQPFSAKTVSVYASKYGGVNRPGYNVTFLKPVSIGV